MPKIATQDRPDYRCKAYEAQLPEMTLVRDVFAGTAAVAAKREEYLPRGPYEPLRAYERKLKSATLYPATIRTLTGLLGLLFKEQPVLHPNVPELIRGKAAKAGEQVKDGYADNIDNAGTSLSEFVKDVAGDALRDGHAAILVDMPEALDRGNNLAGTITLEDVRKAGIRPYWVKITKDQIINWKERNENGKTVLSLLMVEEQVTVDDGLYGEAIETQYREYRNNNGVITLQLKRKILKPKNGEVEFVDIGSTITLSKLTQIPIAPIYGRKLGTFQSTPLLLGMAEENLRHRELRADLRKLLKHSFPIIVTKGQIKNLGTLDGSTQDIGFSPDEIFELEPLPDYDAKMLEPAGTAIAPLAQEIKDCETRMAKLGLSLLEPSQQSGKTTVEAATDRLEEQSEIDFFAASIKDGVEIALSFTAQFIKQATGGNFEIKSAMRKFALTPELLKVYSLMVAQDQFPLDAMLQAMKDSRLTSETFDVKEAIKAIEKSRLDKAKTRQTLFDSGFKDDSGSVPADDTADGDDDGEV